MNLNVSPDRTKPQDETFICLNFSNPLFLAHFPSIYIQFQFVCGVVFAQLRAQLSGRLQTWHRFKVQINKHYNCGNRQIGIVIIPSLSAPVFPLHSPHRPLPLWRWQSVLRPVAFQLSCNGKYEYTRTEVKADIQVKCKHTPRWQIIT